MLPSRPRRSTRAGPSDPPVPQPRCVTRRPPVCAVEGARSANRCAAPFPVGTIGAVDDRPWGFRTRALHAGGRPDPTTGARAVPIYQTTSFVFEDAADAADLFALQKYGNIYTRIANPTIAAFEERMASLEGGIGAVATSSGQAAELLTFTTPGRRRGPPRCQRRPLRRAPTPSSTSSLRRLGIDTTFVPADDPKAFLAAIRPETKALYTEIVANPSGVVADLDGPGGRRPRGRAPAGGGLHPGDAPPVPALRARGRHRRALGDQVHRRPRHVDRRRHRRERHLRLGQAASFPGMTEPVASYGGLRFWENFGEYGFCTKVRVEQLRDFGACLSPFNAFLLLQGLETLAAADGRPRGQRPSGGRAPRRPSGGGVGRRTPACPTRPATSWPEKYLPRGPGSVFAFGVHGGRDAGRDFIEAVELCSHLANIGDTRTLVIHPASTTHQQLSDEALHAAGVAPDLVRISVGIEDVDDILWDLDQALAKAAP